MDPRVEVLARNLLSYSLDLQPGERRERLFIEGATGSEALVRALITEAYRMGVEPHFELIDPKLHRAWLLGASRGQMDRETAWAVRRLEDVEGRLHPGRRQRVRVQ